MPGLFEVVPPDDMDPFDAWLLSSLRPANTPPLELAAYRALVGDLRAPTHSQIEAFADYVSEAKSWYKQLPLRPPGESFQFYIDPYAGFDRLLLQSGEVRLRERTAETPVFHHSWLPTAEYRERFGHLAFACTAGSALFQTEEVDGGPALLNNNPTAPVIQLERTRAALAPTEILQAGQCRLTALVHPRQGEAEMLRRLSCALVELGGADDDSLWTAIVRRSQAVARAGYRSVKDGELAALVEMQRLEEHRAMTAAMGRMCALAFGAA